MVSKQIEFWFEFGSTYSYLTAARVESLARSHGIALIWRPFLLGPIFREQGWEDSPFNIYPAKTLVEVYQVLGNDSRENGPLCLKLL